ncbi:hypothetical protein HOA59_03450 [archaeon]|jgi:hypothetical protein|nr:hypothetical protein [archaeon]MBT6824456.1 hypothetical protein [archaeon]MBT7106841.1 hypothetical protein [archaeon]MBT7297809.1 hypothetical protein [archaeon]
MIKGIVNLFDERELSLDEIVDFNFVENHLNLLDQEVDINLYNSLDSRRTVVESTPEKTLNRLNLFKPYEQKKYEFVHQVYSGIKTEKHYFELKFGDSLSLEFNYLIEFD